MPLLVDLLDPKESKRLKKLLRVLDGTDGEKGDPGERGEKGDKGDKGDPGNDMRIPEELTDRLAQVQVRLDTLSDTMKQVDSGRLLLASEYDETKKYSLTRMSSLEKELHRIHEQMEGEKPERSEIKTKLGDHDKAIKGLGAAVTGLNAFVSNKQNIPLGGVPIGGRTGDILAKTGMQTGAMKWVPASSILGTFTPNQVAVTNGSGVLVTQAVLDAARGGTGLSTGGAAGATLYWDGSTWAALTPGSSSQVLRGGTTPSWGSVNLTSMVTGILPVANGGLGANTYSNGMIAFYTASGPAFFGSTSFTFDPTNQFLNMGSITNIRKIVLMDVPGGTAFNTARLGTTSVDLEYQVATTVGGHSFRAGTSSSTNIEIARFTSIAGTPRLGVGTDAPGSALSGINAGIGPMYRQVVAPDGNLIVESTICIGATFATNNAPFTIVSGTNNTNTMFIKMLNPRSYSTTQSGVQLAFLASNGTMATHDFGLIYFGSPTSTSDGGAAVYQLRLGGTASASSNNGLLHSATMNSAAGFITQNLYAAAGVSAIEWDGNKKISFFGTTNNGQGGNTYLILNGVTGGGPTGNPPAGSFNIWVDTATNRLLAKGSAGTVTQLAVA